MIYRPEAKTRFWSLVSRLQNMTKNINSEMGASSSDPKSKCPFRIAWCHVRVFTPLTPHHEISMTTLHKLEKNTCGILHDFQKSGSSATHVASLTHPQEVSRSTIRPILFFTRARNSAVLLDEQAYFLQFLLHSSALALFFNFFLFFTLSSSSSLHLSL